MKNKWISRFLIQSSILVIGAAVACTFPASERPTATSLPEELPSQPAGSAPTPIPATPTVTESAAPTPYDPDSARAPEAILVAAPGPNSKVISPLVVEGVADSALGNFVIARLFEYDPFGDPRSERLLAEEIVPIQAQMGTNGPFRVELSFEPSVEESLGWVLVSFLDPEDGGLVHAASVQLTLLAAGPAEITESANPEETIEIQLPEAGEVITGGELVFSGYSEYFFESNLGAGLCRTDLEVADPPDHLFCGSSEHLIAQGYAMIAAPDMGFPGPFKGTIAYAVGEEMPARLVVYATSPRDGSLLHLSSVEIVLQP